MKRASARRMLVVLGMHRSGTSALTGCLIRWGAAAPRTLLSEDAGNPLGYWESAPLVAFNDHLLDASGTTWDSWSSVAVPHGVLESQQNDARALLEREFGGASLSVFKDPRLCRLWPFWRAQLAANEVQPLVIIVWRDPDEVALSLAARDGLSPVHARLLWARHVLDAEYLSRGARRAFVSYDTLLSSPARVATSLASDLAITWPSGVADVSDVLQPALRHHHAAERAPVDCTPLGALMTQTQHALDALSSYPSVQSREPEAQLDEARAEFDRMFGDAADALDQARAHDRQHATARRHALDAVVARHEAAQIELGDRLRHMSAERDEALRRAQAMEASREEAMRSVEALLTSRTWRWTQPVRTLLDALARSGRRR